VVRRLGEPELREDAVHVALDGLRTEEELLADPLVRASLGHQAENLSLAWAEPLERVMLAPPAEELRNHLGIDCRATARNAFHRVDELFDVHHALFAEVADLFLPLAYELGGLPRLHDLRADGHTTVQLTGL